MQDLENDMDNLLREAAANYPLRINKGDWEAVASQLSPGAPPAGKRRWRNYLPAVFIFLFLFTGGMFISRESGQARIAGRASATTTKTTTAKQSINKSSSVANRLIVHQPENRQSTFAGIKEVSAGAAEEVIARTALMNNIERSVHIKTNLETAPNKPVSSIDPEPTKTSRNKRDKFYLGLVVGPEGNQVKGQVVSKWDIEGGLIAGYKFNSRFAVESGVLFTKKTYFTKGKYFNMEMPGMELESLHGNITIIEIPLIVKYNFAGGNNWNLFTTAGISSYMLAGETNNYSLMVNGTRQNMVSNYDNASKYFAAAVDLGLGYQVKAGKQLHFRLQPYLKIPLRGIGVGTVPVQSLGAHLGFTYTFR